MEILKLSLTLLSMALLVGCTTAPVVETKSEPESQVERKVSTSGDEAVTALRKRLKVAAQRGLQERPFNSCKEQFKDGLKCGARTFVSLGIRLLCRDSEDTVSTINHKLQPLISDHVQWKLGGQSGVIRTGNDGTGVITAVTAASIAESRLVLTVGKQFLGVEASQASQIVLPIYWCNPR